MYTRKGIQGLTLFPYDRSFTKNDEKHYPAGEDFQWLKDGVEKICCARSTDQLKKYTAKYGKPHHIDSGYPDHAIDGGRPFDLRLIRLVLRLLKQTNQDREQYTYQTRANIVPFIPKLSGFICPSIKSSLHFSNI